MKKKIFSKVVLVLVAVFLSGGFWTMRNVVAEEDAPVNTMFVTPMSQEILLIPGESYEGVISVSNSASSQTDLKYSVKVAPYGRVKNTTDKDDYGAVDVETRSSRNEMMDWIKLNKSNGVVEPNGTDRIIFTIEVPNNAPAGAQYASILVINDGTEEDSSQNMTIKNVYQLASAIFANVAGENIEKGQILSNNVPSFLTAGPLEATSMVKNQGNVYTNAEYTLHVTSIFGGDDICANKEDNNTKLVLPDTERYNVQTCNLPSIGIFKAKQIVKIFGEESIVEKTVIVCPLWLLFVIIFAIILLVMWIVLRMRARQKSSNE